MAEQGAPSASLVEARDKVHPLAEEYNGKLWTWVRERQSAALHAWACALGIRLDFAAYASKDDFLAAMEALVEKRDRFDYILVRPTLACASICPGGMHQGTLGAGSALTVVSATNGGSRSHSFVPESWNMKLSALSLCAVAPMPDGPTQRLGGVRRLRP